MWAENRKVQNTISFPVYVCTKGLKSIYEIRKKDRFSFYRMPSFILDFTMVSKGWEENQRDMALEVN